MNEGFTLKIEVQMNEMISHGIDPTLKIIQPDVTSFPGKHLQSTRAFRTAEVACRSGLDTHTHRPGRMPASPFTGGIERQKDN
jgi:hypothetical protein